jgi:hypothetical protein
MSARANDAEIKHNLVRYDSQGDGYEERHLVGCDTVQQNLLASILIMAAVYSSETLLIFLQTSCQITTKETILFNHSLNH